MSNFKKVLLVCLAGLVFVGTAALAQKTPDTAVPKDSGVIPVQHFLININYDSGSGAANLLGVTLVRGAANLDEQPTGGWRYDVVSAQGEILDHRFINVPITCAAANATDPKAPKTCQENSQFNLTLEIPYNSQAKNINIYDSGAKLVKYVDVFEFAQLCGDGICAANENFLTCPNDCRSGVKDSYCDKADDGVCDPDCTATTDSDCAKIAAMSGAANIPQKSSWWLMPILIIAVIAIVIIAIIFIKKKKGLAPANGQETGGQPTNLPKEN